MDIFWTSLVIFTFAASFFAAFRPGADGPSWDLHWRALDTAERARLVTTASFLAVLAAFALAGLVGTGEFGFIATFFLLTGSAWQYPSEKRITGKLRAVVDAESSAGR